MRYFDGPGYWYAHGCKTNFIQVESAKIIYPVVEHPWNTVHEQDGGYGQAKEEGIVEHVGKILGMDANSGMFT